MYEVPAQPPGQEPEQGNPRYTVGISDGQRQSRVMDDMAKHMGRMQDEHTVVVEVTVGHLKVEVASVDEVELVSLTVTVVGCVVKVRVLCFLEVTEDLAHSAF